jgi:hypothetical protein
MFWTPSFQINGLDVVGLMSGQRAPQTLIHWIPFFGGYLKAQIFIGTPAQSKPRTIPQLKARIEEVIAEINQTPQMLQNVRKGFEERLQLCIDMEGGNIEQIVHKF